MHAKTQHSHADIRPPTADINNAGMQSAAVLLLLQNVKPPTLTTCVYIIANVFKRDKEQLGFYNFRKIILSNYGLASRIVPVFLWRIFFPQ